MIYILLYILYYLSSYLYLIRNLIKNIKIVDQPTKMDKRLSDLVQAFEHLKFEQCLRMSDQILKKIQKSDGKKKNNMSEQDLQIMYLTRVGSLAATGLLHQANQLLLKKFQNPIVSQESFLFLQICSMAFDRRMAVHVTKIVEQGKDNKNIDINRFILLCRKFSTLSRIFLKKYSTQKKPSDAFGQVYLQYLQQLQSQNMIKYHRDNIIHQNKNLNFKFVSVFLQKFISSFKAIQMPKQRVQQNNHKKIQKSIADIRLKICIHQAKSIEVRKLFIQYQKQIKDNIFVYLRSLIRLSEQAQQENNFILWRQQYLKIFRNNLILDAYQPIYDFSVQFISQFVKKTGFVLTQLQQYKQISQQQLYSYKQDPRQQIQNYLNSLYTQYMILKQKQNEYKKKDFYKIAVKNCLLLLIFILSQAKKYNLVQEFLVKYKEDNGKKLTFPDQIWKYYENKHIFTQEFCQNYKAKPQKIDNYQDKLIWEINYQRLFAKNPLQYTYEQNLLQWERLHSLYLVNLVEVEKQKKLEKGQRYLSDQLLTVYADSIRTYLQQSQISQSIRQQLSYLSLCHLEPAIQRSPHNHDLKLRTLYYLSKLNYHQQSLKILQSLDIKAVQFQTLGYWYFKNITNFCTWDSNQNLLIKMVRSYQQTLKQSFQYAYKALVGISFNQCQQNLCYYQNIQHSYNLLLLLYILYMKNKNKSNCQFYLQEILQRIKLFNNNNNKLSFNADFKIIKNVINPHGLPYVDFYGIYNNYNVLANQCKIKLLLTYIAQGAAEAVITELRKNIVTTIQQTKVYDFSQYNIFDKTLQYQFTGGKLHHERNTAVQLKLANKINSIAVDICDFIIAIRKQGLMAQEQYASINASIKQLNQILTNLPWRQQTLLLPQIRFKITQIVSLLSAQIQAYSTKKKKPEGQVQKKQACQDLIHNLINCVTDNIKLQDRVQVQKRYMKQIFVHRDDLLERVTKMSAAELKKFYKIK